MLSAPSAPVSRSVTVLLLLTAACGSRARHAGEVPGSPQAVLEQQLVNRRHKLNKRTSDGGLLYTAELLTTSSENLRVPYDLLKLECESHGGSFGLIAPPEHSAAALAEPSDAPDVVVETLRDADQRGLFGQQRCQLGADAWDAHIEPVSVKTERSAVRLLLYVRAEPAEGYTPGAPLGPGLPPLAAMRAAQPTAAGEMPQPPPSAARAPVTPLDPQPPRPPASGDQLLADPRPFGVDPGVDSPEILARKLGLDLSRATRCDAGGLSCYAWDHPGEEALAARASFADLGSGPVLGELELRYPARSYGWLAHLLGNLLGASDTATEVASSWSWLHTTIDLAQAEGETRIHIAHKPTLDRARLPQGTAGRDQPIAGRIASPWQLQLGYEAAQQAQQKLRTAGFSIAETGCSDGGTAARPVLTRTCPLRGGNQPGLRAAWVRIVDLGDGRARLAELGYQLQSSALDATLRDLKDQYGDPIPSEGGAKQWWTGSIGITLTPSKDGVELRYYNGRLLQYFIVADAKRRGAENSLQRQGL